MIFGASTAPLARNGRLKRIAVLCSILLGLTLIAVTMGPTSGNAQPASRSAGVELSDDGGWCWFQDERAVVVGDRLVVGSVASGWRDPSHKGDIFAIVSDLGKQELVTRLTLHPNFLNGRGAYDDHNAPAFLPLGGNRVLAVYAMHGDENRFYAKTLSIDGGDIRTEDGSFVPSERSRVTYSNLILLNGENTPNGRIYNFYRGLDDSFKPSYAWSDDLGRTWKSGNVFIDVPAEFRHRPYVKYAGNGEDAIHFFYTDGHPRDFDNSVYHVYYRNGMLHRSDGGAIRSLKEGLRSPDEGTRIFAGNSANVAWTSDIHLDSNGNPYVAFSVQKDAAGLPESKDGMDHRYYYARWDGSRWRQHEIGYAGSRLYAKEADYTGNICLDPQDPSRVYFSTNADPTTGAPLVSKADGKRHWELFQGVTFNGGSTWKFTALTTNSTSDNLRPIVPIWPNPKRLALLWLKGQYHAYTDFRQAVMLRELDR